MTITPETPTATGTTAVADGAAAAKDAVVDGATAVADAAKPVIDATTSGVSAAGTRMNELGKDAGDWWNSFTTGMDGWDVAGTGIVAILGWLIGNAFGGGGLMGLIIGGMLVIGLSTMGNGQLGKNIGEMLRGEPNANLLNGPEVALKPEIAPETRVEAAPEKVPTTDRPPIPAAAIDEYIRGMADQATQGTNFTTAALDSPLMLPPREQVARTIG